MTPECSQTASGGLLGVSWGAPGPQEGWPQIRLRPLDAYLTIFGRPGGGQELSGEPLGPLWALLGRLLALPGVFFEVSEAISAAVGQEAWKREGFCTMF